MGGDSGSLAARIGAISCAWLMRGIVELWIRGAVPGLGLCLLVLVAVVAPAREGRAALIDAPPREHSFTLDGPAAPRYPMLSVFRDGRYERPGPMRLYLTGRWGQWSTEAWGELSWAPGEGSRASHPWWDLDGTAHDRGASLDPFATWGTPAPAPPQLRVPRDPKRATHLARAWNPYWMQRLMPGYRAPVVASTGVRFESNGFDVLFHLKPVKPVVDWRCRRRPVQFVRYEGEHDRFPLVRCDGTVEPEALDRLTLLARINGTPRGEDLLPEEPHSDAWSTHREWMNGVKIMHPRMIWVLQQLADAFPWKSIYLFSGYRRLEEDERRGGHHSLHADGRALDLRVYGVPNEEVFKVCRKLRDVGCGYYPNGPFVHVDVRLPRTGRAFWVDTSAPGEPSNYVDSWPGVVDGGALVWAQR